MKKQGRCQMNDPQGLGWDRDISPSLYDLYAKKLPWRGWAGQKSPEEKAYIRGVKANMRKNH